MYMTLRKGIGQLSAGTRVEVTDDGYAMATVAKVDDRSFFDKDGKQQHRVEHRGTIGVMVKLPDDKSIVVHGLKTPAKVKTSNKTQHDVRRMVEENVTPVMKAVGGPKSDVDWALVRAIYNHDRRMDD